MGTSRPMNANNNQQNDSQDKFDLLSSFCNRGLLNKLTEELEKNNTEKSNLMKIELAYEILKSDNYDCLDIILKSLKGNIPNAPQLVKDLIKQATNYSAKRCLATLHAYNYTEAGYCAGLWATFLFSSQSYRDKFVVEENLKYQCAKQSTDELSNSGNRSSI